MHCSVHRRRLGRPYQSQGGFVLVAIMAAIMILGIVGAIVMSAGDRDYSSISDYSQSGLATSVTNQAATLRSGFAEMMISGTAADTITFDSVATTGLFGADGAAEIQTPLPDVMTSVANGVWTYKKTVILKNVGPSTAADYIVALPYVKSGVCQAINQRFKGDATIPVMTAGTIAAWADGTNGTDTAIDLSGDANTDGVLRQCVETTDGDYVFYLAVVPR